MEYNSGLVRLEQRYRLAVLVRRSITSGDLTVMDAFWSAQGFLLSGWFVERW